MMTLRSIAAAATAVVLAASCALAQKSHQFDLDTAITIPDSGNAAPFPSSITVSGINAPMGEVKVVLRGLTHTFMTDLDILLVGPGGQNVVLCNRIGGSNPGPVGATYVIAQNANPFPETTVPVSGRYSPTRRVNGAVAPTFPAPAPAGPYGTTLDAFKGLPANGTWSLYIRDQAGGDQGTLAGWSLIISEAPSYANEGVVTIPGGAPTTTFGPASPYPATVIVDGVEGSVRSVQVMLAGLSHTFQSDLRFMLQGPGGQTCLLYSNCGDSTDWVNADLVFDDNAAATLTTTGSAPGTYRPSVCFGSTGSLIAPAPPAPYGSALSVFNGTNPNGAWRLWVQDTASSDVGQLARGFSVIVNGQACAADFNKSGTLEVQDIFDFLNQWFAGCP